MSHWLVTWEASNATLLPARRVALVLDSRRSAMDVRRTIEALYISYSYSEGEALSAVRSNPYPAEFAVVDGATFEGQIFCGHNPHLFARLVEDLEEGAAGGLVWQERPRFVPKMSSSA